MDSHVYYPTAIKIGDYRMTIRRRPLRGLIAAAIIVASTVAAAPSAAHAEPNQVRFTLVSSGFTDKDGYGFLERDGQAISLHPEGGVRYLSIADAKVVVDISEIASFATVRMTHVNEGGQCTPEGTRITCDIGGVGYRQGHLPGLFLERKHSAEPVGVGQLAVTLSGEGLEPFVARTRVTVLDEVDLAVRVADTPVVAEPGKPLMLPIEVSNVGTTPAYGFILTLGGEDGVEVIGDHSNCRYQAQQAEYIDWAYCQVDEVLEPGAKHLLPVPVLAVRGGTLNKRDVGYFVGVMAGADNLSAEAVLDGYPLGKSGRLSFGIGEPVPVNARRNVDSAKHNNVSRGRVPLTAGSAPAGPQSPEAGLPSASSAPTAGAAAGAGGGLPTTGAPIGAVIGAGAGLLLLGATGLWLARRRRASFIA